MIRRPYFISSYTHYGQTMWNLVKILSGIFIVDLACENMYNADKTGALLKKLAYQELRPHASAFGGGGGGSTHSTKIINFVTKNKYLSNCSKSKHFTHCDPYPPSHLAEYLSDDQYTSSMDQTFQNFLHSFQSIRNLLKTF